ncbi:MAG: C40 family peptidase [Pyrinomonadaceae bacterium]|nr:C40 family peptidase [Pyrinomonadaceae bacterium]
MSNRIFPRVFALSLVLGLFTSIATAQESNLRLPQLSAVTNDSNGASRLENDAIIISLAEPVGREVSSPLTSAPAVSSTTARFNQMLIAAIDQRLGSPYVWGATGPRVFDCSGFVWSAFGSAGIRFDRTSARTLWTQFAPARDDEKYRLGTLVFFNGLTHVGIVADEHGFYHASSSKGVTYSTFKGYWAGRIDGFRRIPLPAEQIAE